MVGEAGGIIPRAASIAAAAMSARITMPAPPPAGVSSTERCLSVAKSRMSMVCSDHFSFDQCLAGEAQAQRPRKEVRHDGEDGGAPSHASPSSVSGSTRVMRRSSVSISGTVASVNGRSRVSSLVGELHLDDVAGAEIMHRDHGADLNLEGIVSGKPDQIGMVPGAFLGRRETIARHVELGAGQRLGALARGDALDPRDQALRARSHGCNHDRVGTRLVLERAVVGDGGGRLA